MDDHIHGRGEERVFIGPHIYASQWSALGLGHLRRPAPAPAHMPWSPARTNTMATVTTIDTEPSDSSSSSSSSNSNSSNSSRNNSDAESGVSDSEDAPAQQRRRGHHARRPPSPGRRRRLFARQEADLDATIDSADHPRIASGLAPSRWQRLRHTLAPPPAVKARATGTFASFAQTNHAQAPPMPPPPGMPLPSIGTSAGGTRWIVTPFQEFPSIYHTLDRRIRSLSAQSDTASSQRAPTFTLTPPEKLKTPTSTSALTSSALRRDLVSDTSSHSPKSASCTLPETSTVTKSHRKPLPSPSSLPVPLSDPPPVRQAHTLATPERAGSNGAHAALIESHDGWEDVIRRLSTVHGELSHTSSPVSSPFVPRLKLGAAPSPASAKRSTPLPEANLGPEVGVGPKNEAYPWTPLPAMPESAAQTPLQPPSVLLPSHSSTPHTDQRVSFASTPNASQLMPHHTSTLRPAELDLSQTRSPMEASEEELSRYLDGANATLHPPGEDGRHSMAHQFAHHLEAAFIIPPLPPLPRHSDGERATIVRRDRMLVRAEWTPVSPLPTLWDELAAARVPFRAIGPWNERLVVLRHLGGGHEQLEIWAPERMKDKIVHGLRNSLHPLGSPAAESLDTALASAPALGQASVQGLTRIQTIPVGDRRVGLSLYSPIDYLFSITITNGSKPAAPTKHNTKTLNSESEGWVMSMGTSMGMGIGAGISDKDPTMRTNLLALRRSGGGTKIYLFTPPSHSAGLAWIWSLRPHLAQVGARMTSAVTTVWGPGGRADSRWSRAGRRRGFGKGKSTSTSQPFRHAAPVAPFVDVAVPDINVRVRIPVPVDDTAEAREVLGLKRIGNILPSEDPVHPAFLSSGGNGLGYRLLTPQVVRAIVGQTMLMRKDVGPDDGWSAILEVSRKTRIPLRLAWRVGTRLEWLPEVGGHADSVVSGLLLATREHPKPKLELRPALHAFHALPAPLVHTAMQEVIERAGESPDKVQPQELIPDLVPHVKDKAKDAQQDSVTQDPVKELSPKQDASEQDDQAEENIEEPPGAEGYLWRVRPVTGTLTRLYAILRRGRQFVCPLSRAFPPPTGLQPLLHLTAVGPPEQSESQSDRSLRLEERHLPEHLPRIRRPSTFTAASNNMEQRRTLALRPGMPKWHSNNQRSGLPGGEDTGWNAERAYLLDQVVRTLSAEHRKITDADSPIPVETVAVPALAADLERLLAVLLWWIRQDILADHPSPSRLREIQLAYHAYEKHRHTLQFQNAEGFVDVSDVVRSGLVGGKVSLSEVKDDGGQEGLAAHPPEEQGRIKSLRQMEMVLSNGQRVVMEAFSVASAVRWVELLRAHTVYQRAHAKVVSADLMRLGKFANTHAHHGQSWGDMSTTLSKLWTWCPISACQAVRFMGPLYRKHSARAPFERRTYVLTQGLLTGFMITHSQKTARARLDAGIFHKRVSSIPLEGAYVYSGALALEWIPEHAQHAAPGASALAGGGGGAHSAIGAGADGRVGAVVAQAQRVYEDGLQTSDAEADCLFVVRYRLPRAQRRGESHRADKDLEARSASLVLLARSHAERDIWVKQLAYEMERLQRRTHPRGTN